MEVLSAELVRNLVRWRSSGRPVVSLYLNVDGRANIRAEDYCQHLDALIKDALSNGDADETLVTELDRVSSFVKHEFERKNNRGLALFASGDELWQVVALPLPVEDHLVINSSAHVRRLENMLDDNETVGVLVTDKQRARLMVIELGKVVARQEVVDPLPRHDDDKGDWRKDHVKTHASAAARQHLRRAANEMFELYKKQHFSHLVLCVAEEAGQELERQLHAYLRSKVAGRCSVPIGASDDEIVIAVREIVRRKERETEEKYVERLRSRLPAPVAPSTAESNVGLHGAAVAGLDPTLKAIFEKRVETLLVSEGFVAEGWRCNSCHYIATLGRTCAMCGSEMSLVHDVIEEAVEDALAQKCHVEFCHENADLDVMGQIGALLRY